MSLASMAWWMRVGIVYALTLFKLEIVSLFLTPDELIPPTLKKGMGPV